jgi:hypothetical protein
MVASTLAGMQTHHVSTIILRTMAQELSPNDMH